MNRIKQLPVNLINQIAAGEVIERPASVVKELVENSIDAGASKIEINISNECRNIRIADNGSGIHPDDIELAFLKHATSKITDEDNLFNIQTLGFRGEALASIISVAKVTCTTRTKEFDFGTKVESQNSIIKSSRTGCAQGTIMEVNDLFFNQPARLKFLKNPKTEFAYIQEYVQALALSHPEIAFKLKNNGADVINAPKDTSLLTRITQIYSPSVINEIKEVNKKDLLSGMQISGYVSLPSYSRSSKKSVYTFVNSRTVKCPILIKAIDMAYKNMLPSGRYPFVVINLEIDPQDIDVNAHPTKREIRYKNPNQIFSFVQSAVSFALNSYNFKQESENSDNLVPFEKPTLPEFGLYSEEELSNSNENPIQISEKLNKKPLVTEEIIAPQQKNIDLKLEIPINVKQVNVIGQFKNTYILVENDDNLEIIDQHIAQERYIYENLKKSKEIASQLLIVSDVIDAEPSDVDIIINAKEYLAKYGYQVEKISDTQVIFKKIPQILSKVKSNDILSELLNNLKDSPSNDIDTLEEKILITTACKASVKAGEKLTLWQMEEIVRNLRKTKNPYTCPHGRPISHFIPLKEVASFFDRTLK